MTELRIKTGPIPAGGKPVHLLVPVPPSTPEQTCVGLESRLSCNPPEVRAVNGEQRAFVFDVPPTGIAEFMFFFTDPKCHCVRSEQFQPVESSYTLPSPELSEHVQQILDGRTTDSDKLSALVDFTRSIFDYDHPERPFNYGMERVPMLMALTKGSCTDIHGFLVSMMRAAHMPIAYYAGCFFADGTNRSAGFHCWCGTLPEGELTYWDIAQQIKLGSGIKPGINPVGGRRYAFSCGRGLIFKIENIETHVGHLGVPTWIFEDGSSCAFGATGEIV